MTKTIENEEAAEKMEDWAIIPFDEAEDNARWTKLIEETDKLIKAAEKTANRYGISLTKSRLNDLRQTDESTEDAVF